ncbi:hypothetical protein ABEX47_01465 [Paenibacillus ehimensis]|uniref:hypothetical protein n=1 Tax=Paenibacillus ehimensis TaxID=79264 RepID=UPI0013E2FB35|nr:hypothetical protein [Paenibacillus ehimensis]MEC0209336.1 hypothetical protein [Paenibacillus ehimensis]
MIQKVMEYSPSGSIWLCAFLTWAIPYAVHRVNRKLHEIADPPWKKEEQEESKGSRLDG